MSVNPDLPEAYRALLSEAMDRQVLQASALMPGGLLDQLRTSELKVVKLRELVNILVMLSPNVDMVYVNRVLDETS